MMLYRCEHVGNSVFNERLGKPLEENSTQYTESIYTYIGHTSLVAKVVAATGECRCRLPHSQFQAIG